METTETATNPAVPDIALLRAKLDAHVQAIRSALKQGGLAQYDAGQHFNEISKGGFVRALKYKSVQDLIDQNFPETSQSSLFLWGGVADRFSRDDAARFGMVRLDRLIRYENQVLGEQRTGDPGGRDVRVPNEDGTVEAKKFCDLSVRDLERACRLKKAPPTGDQSVPAPSPSDDKPDLMHGLAGLATFITGSVVASVAKTLHLDTIAFIGAVIGLFGFGYTVKEARGLFSIGVGWVIARLPRVFAKLVPQRKAFESQ